MRAEHIPIQQIAKVLTAILSQLEALVLEHLSVTYSLMLFATCGSELLKIN
jgi:hypothetical protein